MTTKPAALARTDNAEGSPSFEELKQREELIERRLAEFETAILSLAGGNFDHLPPMTGEDEMLDGIASGINMLAEELRATTVTKDYLDDVLDAMLDVLLVLSSDGTILQVNRSARKILGYDPGELVGLGAAELFTGDEASVTPNRLASLIESGPIHEVHAALRTKQGKEFPVHVSMSVMAESEQNRRKTRIVLVARDITERNRAQQALEHANKDLEHLVHELEQRTEELDIIGEMGEVLQSCHTVDEAFEVLASFLPRLFPTKRGAVCITTASGNVLEARTTWNDFPDDMIQRVFAPDQCWGLRRGRVHSATVAGRGGSGVRCRHVDPEYEGAYICIPMMAQSEALGVLHLRTVQANGEFQEAKIRLAHTISEHIALALANITLRESLRNQSIRDPLTGLFNRRYMEETLERELHRSARAGRPLGMAMIDVDHFKNFNDTFGHEAGDLVLRAVGTILENHTRSEDIACRIGGEEFALILPDASLEDTYQRAEQLRKQISSLNLQYREQGLATITISAGVSAAPKHGMDLKQLVRAADSALYRAKAEGRDKTLKAPST